MQKGLSVCLTGIGVVDAVKTLGRRLVEMGRGVEVFSTEEVRKLGGAKRAAYVCGLLARNGIVVVVTDKAVCPEGEVIRAEVDAHDTPDFAAEKILDELAATGAVTLEAVDYSPEEEEAIRKRLADLGYIE